MTEEIKINKLNKSIAFINNGIAYSQFGIADEILDLITNLQQENETLKAIAEEHKNCTRKHWQQKCFEHNANEGIYKSRLEKASNKLDSMFANGKENKILDDLLELDKIVKGDKQW